MTDNDPNTNDEIDEIEFDELDPLPTDSSDIEESEHATTDVAPADLIDLIANQKASEARAEIFRSLYSKVGERIDGMKSNFRSLPNEN
jgi:hypothetical protein